ncbi:hypothetical protein SAMN05414137_13026 [Streptacidiphilus jiangxiensis]|uniref:Uncharacterized protein n=1 Tax=Streptacidiphilus jiangxiensis TaxID=235985 RepID=A0A1H7YQX2_STRJI|nr:hypothetical protein SAMN05414137_13026 [Streptacidiphilus jiangxiensis]
MTAERKSVAHSRRDLRTMTPRQAAQAQWDEAAEHRGHGYAEELPAEGTRILAADGAELIRAGTDVGNAPMAASFARTGYDVFQRVLLMSWDRPASAWSSSGSQSRPGRYSSQRREAPVSAKARSSAGTPGSGRSRCQTRDQA